MSSNKRGGGADQFYSTHLYGSGYYANNSINRERAIQQLLENQLTDMRLNLFAWENLPETWDKRFLESMLLINGLAIVYYDREFEALLAVRGSGHGYVNMLDNPVEFTMIGPGEKMPTNTEIELSKYYNKSIKAYQPMLHKKLGDEYQAKDKCIPIWNNYTRTGDTEIIRIYASRLAWIDRTLEINTRAARRNKVVKGSPNTQLSMVNFARQLDEGNELLQVTGPMEDMAFIEALDLGVNPDAYEKLGVHRTRVWNECMIMLGIDSANQEKKERMVAAEVSANDSQADAVRFKSLNARREAVEQINEVFGTNIKVDYHIEIENKEKAEEAAELQQSTQPDPNRVDAREGGN